MPDTFELEMKMLTDKNGFIDRECPREDCLFNFKIDAADWDAHLQDNDMYCPRCGHKDDAGMWWTAPQSEAIRTNAESAAYGIASDLIDSIMGDFVRGLNRSSGISASYIPGARPEYTDLPIEQTAGWATEIVCSDCGTRFSVIGNAYFCPHCGKDLTTNAIFDSLRSYHQRIDNLEQLYEWFTSVFTAEEAERQITQQREDIIKSLVDSFESFARNRYLELGGTLDRRDGNIFQRVKDGSDRFRDLTGKEYIDFIDGSDMADLVILVNRRHLLTHRNGIIDDRYLSNSGDSDYELGQRIVVNDEDLVRLLDLIEKIIKGLSQIA